MHQGVYQKLNFLIAFDRPRGSYDAYFFNGGIFSLTKKSTVMSTVNAAGEGGAGAAKRLRVLHRSLNADQTLDCYPDLRALLESRVVPRPSSAVEARERCPDPRMLPRSLDCSLYP